MHEVRDYTLEPHAVRLKPYSADVFGLDEVDSKP